MNSRAVATQYLLSVIDKSESLSVPAELEDAPFVREVCFGVCRYFHQLAFIAKQLVQKQPKDQAVYVLILIGIYQLLYMRLPDYAATAETVDAAKQLKKQWATKLINGVLRNVQRRKDELLAAVDENPAAKFSHPDWLLKRLQAAYPEQWQAICEANNQRAPLTLRVNQQKISRQAYLQKLLEQDISASATNQSDVGIELAKPMNVTELPGFDDGEISVQDEAAQMAASLMDLQPGMRVLDACAAPGGKTAHMLEACAELDMLAIDNDAKRSERIHENLQRLQLNADVKVADVGDVETWWDGQPFDRILLDAPCSATGVIRRHPDIKLLRRNSDIDVLAETQLTLLQALWALVKPQGKLVYATCSVLPEENNKIIEQFSQAHDNINLNTPIQYLPNPTDGFFYSVLTKK